MMRKGRTMPSQHTSITPHKAKEMLRHGEVRGHPLSEKQKGLFGAIAGKSEKKRRG